MLCSWSWRAITFWRRHLLSTQWVCVWLLSHTYLPSMVTTAVWIQCNGTLPSSSSQIAISPLGLLQTNSNTTLQEVFVLGKLKGQTNFNLVSKIRASYYYHFVQVCCVINRIRQHGCTCSLPPAQELSSGADRPLSGSRSGQSPGCLVQIKASDIALLCLLTTWLCH